MNNLFQDYLNDLMTRTERAMPSFKPHCCECGSPIEGTAYNGRCGPCAQQIGREDQASSEQAWRDQDRE